MTYEQIHLLLALLGHAILCLAYAQDLLKHLRHLW